jgi:PAS domain S-box-containing protein
MLDDLTTLSMGGAAGILLYGIFHSFLRHSFLRAKQNPQALNQYPMAVLSVNASGQILNANGAFLQLYQKRFHQNLSHADLKQLMIQDVLGLDVLLNRPPIPDDSKEVNTLNWGSLKQHLMSSPSGHTIRFPNAQTAEGFLNLLLLNFPELNQGKLFSTEPQYVIALMEEKTCRPIETKFNQNEERLKRLMDDNLVGMITCRVDNAVILDANDTFLKMTGYTKKELLCQELNWQAITPPEFQLVDEAAVKEILEFGKLTPFEKQYVHKDGHRIDVLISGVMTHVEQSECIALIVDMTQRKNAERLLKKSRDMFELVQKVTQDAVWDWDIKSGDIYWSQGIQTQFLYPDMPNVENLNWWKERIHPDEVDGVLQSLQEAFDKKDTTWSSRYRFRKANDEYTLVQDRGYIIYGETTNEPERMIGSMMDIGSQSYYETQLRQTLMREKLLRQITDFSSRSMDMDEIIQFALEKITFFFQVDRAAIARYIPVPGVGEGSFKVVLAGQYSLDGNNIAPDSPELSLLQQIHPQFNQPVSERSSIEMALSDTHNCHTELKNLCHFFNLNGLEQAAISGMENYLRANNIRAVLSAEIIYRGISYGQLSIHQYDLPRQWSQEEMFLLKTLATQMGLAFYQTDLFQKERQSRSMAETANLNKSHFLANMSHELRTPLNAIIGFTDMLQNREQLSLEKRQHYLGIINQNGRHLLNLVHDLLDISRIETGKFSLNLDYVDLSTVLQEVVDLLQPMAEQKRVSLTISVQEPLAPIEADSARLKQIIINLIHNGIKFNQANGQVTCKIKTDQEWLTLTVEDTGIGMHTTELEALFSQFYQHEKNLNRRFDGCGLGLTLTKQLVELHKGYLTVDSKPAQGSRFTVRLPLKASPLSSSLQNTTTPPLPTVEKTLQTATAILSK